MTEHQIATREEWDAARERLLVREKEHTRLGDELARRLLLDASVPFLQKPFPPDELVKRVQEFLELRAQGPDD